MIPRPRSWLGFARVSLALIPPPAQKTANPLGRGEENRVDATGGGTTSGGREARRRQQKTGSTRTFAVHGRGKVAAVEVRALIVERARRGRHALGLGQHAERLRAGDHRVAVRLRDPMADDDEETARARGRREVERGAHHRGAREGFGRDERGDVDRRNPVGTHRRRVRQRNRRAAARALGEERADARVGKERRQESDQDAPG